MSVSKELRFKDVDGKETTIEFAVNAENIQESNFTEAKVRENLKSGENLTKMLGKLAKWFTDLSKLAWSGKWADVGDKPGIGDLEGTLGVEKGGTGATSASDARTNLGIGAAATYPIADNDTTNNANYVPTARIVYEHGKEIDALSRDLSAMNDNGAITGMDAREDGVYITYVPADGADPVSKKLGSNGITYLGDMPYTCTQDYGDCTLLTFCHQKTATQNVTIKNLNGSYNIKQIVPAHIGGVLCFLAIVDVTNLNKGATIDTESSDTKRVFII